MLAHLQLTPEEYEKWKGVPVLYHGDLGFFIEPRAETHIMKVRRQLAIVFEINAYILP